MMTKPLSAFVLLAAIACAPPEERANTDTTTSLPAIDTLKVATDSMSPRDSVADTPAQAKTSVTGTKTSVTGTKTAGGTKARRDSIIGYDKVTPFDPNKKLLDTVKKRPPR